VGGNNMETISLKALANKVLSGNIHGNNMETGASNSGNIHGNLTGNISSNGNMGNRQGNLEHLPSRHAVLVWSEILQSHLWVIHDEGDRANLISTNAIYTHDEIRRLKGSSQDHLKAVQNVKSGFPDSKVIGMDKDARK